MSKCTYFENLLDPKNPKDVDVMDILKSFKESKALKAQVTELRGLTDRKAIEKAKANLKCICFSGTFTYRNDEYITSHSGYAIFDFDKVDPDQVKQSVRPYPFVVAAFASPTGTGCKVLIRIPADIERHEGHYLAAIRKLNWLNGLDTTSKNISRVCYASYDPDMYLNPDATVFDDYVEPSAKIQSGEAVTAQNTDWKKLDVLAKMISGAKEGEKHKTLLKAAHLAGGWVSGGIIEQDVATYVLEHEIGKRNPDDFERAKKTIRDGIEMGKTKPLQEIEREFNAVAESEILAPREDIDEYLMTWRAGKQKMGLKTGMPSLDKYMSFKRGNLVICNGNDNVGKTTTILFMLACISFKHNWRWIIYCSENEGGNIAQILMEFHASKCLNEMTDAEYSRANIWMNEHFSIMKADDMISAEELMDKAEIVNATREHHGLFVDPYNSLAAPLSKNSHDYHYQAISRFKFFGRSNNLTTVINCHAVSSALRTKNDNGKYAGYPAPPSKYDTEGGGKWANKADEFLTIHRYVNHDTDYNLTFVYVNKVKVYATGGSLTPHEQPVVLRYVPKNRTFVDDDSGYNTFTNSSVLSPTFSSAKATQQAPIESPKPVTISNPNAFTEPVKPENDEYDNGEAPF